MSQNGVFDHLGVRYRISRTSTDLPLAAPQSSPTKPTTLAACLLRRTRISFRQFRRSAFSAHPCPFPPKTLSMSSPIALAIINWVCQQSGKSLIPPPLITTQFYVLSNWLFHDQEGGYPPPYRIPPPLSCSPSLVSPSFCSAPLLLTVHPSSLVLLSKKLIPLEVSAAPTPPSPPC
jgi:hypothetical protein